MDIDRPIHPYQHGDGRPRLRNSWVLYLDALGTKARARDLTDEDLYRRFAPEGWYHRFLHHGSETEHQRALYFTDNVVIGVPADAEARNPLVSLSELQSGAATYIVGMAIESGLAIRGSIAFGPAYIDDVVLDDPLARVQAAHGSALVEAAALEDMTRQPCVAIAESVMAEVERLIASYPGEAITRPTDAWLRDEEGVVFVDHLGTELALEPNLSIRHSEGRLEPTPRAVLLARYADFISGGLARGGDIASKYEWLVDYFDWIVDRWRVGERMRSRPLRGLEYV